MRMRGRGLSQVTTNRQTAAAAALPAGSHLRATPEGAGTPPGSKPGTSPGGKPGGGRPPSENVTRENLPGRLPGLAARRKGVLEPGPLPKTGNSVTNAKSVSVGRGAKSKTKHVPAPLKLPLRSNNVTTTAPIAHPETASSAPTTPWQLPSLTDQVLPKFPFNNDLAAAGNLPNKLPKLLGADSQPSTPTRPNCLQDLLNCTNYLLF